MGAVTSGAVELGGIVGVVSFPSINKNFNVASFPGLFNSWEQQRGFFQNSSTGKAIWGDLTKKTNDKFISWINKGPVLFCAHNGYQFDYMLTSTHLFTNLFYLLGQLDAMERGDADGIGGGHR